MKARSFKHMLSSYGITVMWMSFLDMLLIVYGGRYLSTKLTAIDGHFLAGQVSLIMNIIILKTINNKLYKRYQKRLQNDALEMAELLRQNHLGNPKKLDELITELREAHVLNNK